MYNAAVWLRQVGEARGEPVEVRWRPFSLDQANSKEEGWKAWEQPDEATRGMLALRAGEAARRQGERAFDEFHLALLRARHEDRSDLADRAVILEVAGRAGLDVERLRRDLDDPALAEAVGREHTDAVERYGVFGTPTFVFENGNSAFLKMLRPPAGEEVALFEEFVNLFARRPYVGEVKRPQPPWPRGVFD